MAITLLVSNPSLALDCRPVKDMTAHILTEKRQAIFAFAIAYRTFPIIIYLSKYGDYTVVAVDDQLRACIILSGDNFQFALTRKANAP